QLVLLAQRRIAEHALGRGPREADGLCAPGIPAAIGRDPTASPAHQAPVALRGIERPEPNRIEPAPALLPGLARPAAGIYVVLAAHQVLRGRMRKEPGEAMSQVAEAAQPSLIAMDDDVAHRADLGRAGLAEQVERLHEPAPPQGVDGRMHIEARAAAG